MRYAVTAEDNLLHIYECPWVLILPDGNPSFQRCGHIARGAGSCPYDHAGEVTLVPLTALVLCSDCRQPIRIWDSRGSDGRLLCDQCVVSELVETH